MVITDKYVYFWNGIYSQWYPSKMVIDGIEFNCCEQFMMYKKALYFNDIDVANEILKIDNPNEQKSLGRRIKNFDKSEWDKVNLQIVYEGNFNKFSQNDKLKEELLKTENRIIVEASPKDQIWGIGLSEDDSSINDPINWKGQNLLGWAIMLVKQTLK